MGSGYPSLRFYPTVEGCACNEVFAVVGGLRGGDDWDRRESRSRQTLRSLICLGLKGRPVSMIVPDRSPSAATSIWSDSASSASFASASLAVSTTTENAPSLSLILACIQSRPFP